MSEFKMPSLGADMESAVLMEWMVKEGDHVTKGQVIAEVETSKGVIEIEVFEDGIVEKILVEEETECAVGMPLALIRSENEELEESAADTFPEPEAKPLEPEPSKEPALMPANELSSRERVKASPAARRKARELGVDLAELASGTGGTIQLSKVEAAAATLHKIPESDGIRQAIARAMSRSNAEIPHYYLSTSINMTPALEWLAALNGKRSIKDRILPAALLIRAVVRTLEEVPELNGFWQEDTHRVSEAVNPGIAIVLRKGGLITPALLNAQQMNLDETMHSLGDLITRTRSGKLRGSEMTQQTVTITNLGDLGVERVYGVIYPPQVAIVGLGRISDTPWAEGDALSVRKVMQATIAGDHRATDGRTGALFLDRLNNFLQKPEELL
ncbi:MAG: dihydrolipoamide acetyltransferase family protein [Campylobacterota bacterium]|nr:dihydrolipoamide acetyltransferase family protein [Campylobacterota bacterium]